MRIDTPPAVNSTPSLARYSTVGSADPVWPATSTAKNVLSARKESEATTFADDNGSLP